MNIKKISLLGLLLLTISNQTHSMGLNKETLLLGTGLASLAAISWYGVKNYNKNNNSIDDNNLVEDCIICLNSMDQEKMCVDLGCGGTETAHKFHTECIRQDIRQTNPTCPFCRRNITATAHPKLFAEDFYEDILPDIKSIAHSSAAHSFAVIIPYIITKNLQFYYDLNLFQATLICMGLCSGFGAGLHVYCNKIMISKKRETLSKYAQCVALATGCFLGNKILSSQIHININAHSGKAIIQNSFIFTGVPPRLIPEFNSQLANYLKNIAASAS